MSKNLKARIINKHDTEENWILATNFIPKKGEIIIYEKDATHSENRIKIGNGESSINELPFEVSKEYTSNLIDNKLSIWEIPDNSIKTEKILSNAITPDKVSKEFKQTKNLLALPDMETKRYSNTDITIKDGVITLNTVGEETNSTCIRINFSHPGGYDFSGDASNTAWKTENVPFMAIGKSYIFSIVEAGGTKVLPSGTGRFAFGVRGVSDNVLISQVSSPKVLSASPSYIYLFVAPLCTFSNYKFKLQIEEGNKSLGYVNPNSLVTEELKLDIVDLYSKLNELDTRLGGIENGTY